MRCHLLADLAVPLLLLVIYLCCYCAHDCRFVLSLVDLFRSKRFSRRAAFLFH